MDLSEALSCCAEMEVAFGEHRLKVVYNPQKVTPEMFHRMIRNPGDEVAGDIEAQALADLLVEWGLTNAGAPVGIDFPTLRKQPVQILDKVLSAILQHMRPDRDSPEP